MAGEDGDKLRNTLNTRKVTREEDYRTTRMWDYGTALKS